MLRLTTATPKSLQTLYSASKLASPFVRQSRSYSVSNINNNNKSLTNPTTTALQIKETKPFELSLLNKMQADSQKHDKFMSFKKDFDDMPSGQQVKLIIDAIKGSPVRKKYVEETQAMKEDVLVYATQSKFAMDMGYSPLGQTEPIVQLRQTQKNKAREATPPFVAAFIKERQAKKYGDGTTGEKIQDPTVGSLLLKQLNDKSVPNSPESAAVNVMLSAVRPNPDIFSEIEAWLKVQPQPVIYSAVNDLLTHSGMKVEDLAALVKKSTSENIQ